MTSEMHVNNRNSKTVNTHLGRFNSSCGNDMLSRLKLLMANEDEQSDPPTPPEPEEFIDKLQDSQLRTDRQPRVNYYSLALKTWPDGNPFDTKPLTHPADCDFHLQAPPTQSSSSSRDPSPNTTTSQAANLSGEPKKRRYEPRFKNQKYHRRPRGDDEFFLGPTENFRFSNPVVAQQRGSQLLDGRHFSDPCSPTSQSPSSPLLTPFSSKTSQSSVVRKLSIRQLQRPRMFFDDQETHSSDEMSNIQERLQHNNLEKSHSGSLPIIIANKYSNDAEPQETNTRLSNSSLPLDKNNSTVNSTMSIDADSTGDFRIPRMPLLESDDVLNEHSNCSDKANELLQFTPSPNSTEFNFVFERRKSLIQELPAITEDQLDEKNDTWHSANDSVIESSSFVHTRSISDYTIEKPSSSLERHRSENLTRVSKSGERVGSDQSSFLDTNGTSMMKHLNGKSRKHSASVLIDPSEYAELPTRHKTSSLVLQQDGSKTLQLVETAKSDYPDVKPHVCHNVETTTLYDLLDQGSKKTRILKRKSKLKRHKSLLRVVRAAPISSAVDHIAPAFIQNAERIQPDTTSLPDSSVVLRAASVALPLTRKRSGTDKKKIFSLFGSTRVKERKDSRLIFQQQPETLNGGGAIPSDRKRLSLAEVWPNHSNRNSMNGTQPCCQCQMMSEPMCYDCNYLFAGASLRPSDLSHYRSTGDLRNRSPVSSSLPMSPNISATQMIRYETPNTFVLNKLHRPGELRLVRYPSRRSTTVLHSPKLGESRKAEPVFKCGTITGSLADIQQFHSSFNRNYQRMSIEQKEMKEFEQDMLFTQSILCCRKAPQLADLKQSFTSTSSSSSTESNIQTIEETRHPVIEGKDVVFDCRALSNTTIPNFKFQPASPSIERTKLKWTAKHDPSPTTHLSRHCKTSNVAKLSTDDDDEYCSSGCRPSLSKSPTRVSDQILVEEKVSAPSEPPSNTKSALGSNVLTNDLTKTSFYKFVSLRRKKPKFMKAKDDTSLLSRSQDRSSWYGKRLSNALLFDSNEQKTLIEGLPDVLARVLLSSSETDLKNGANSNYSSLDDATWPQLQKKKWLDLELWQDDIASWSELFPDIKPSAGEEKRQNIIYEFYITEKRHCQVVVFMQQIFQVGLLQHNILNANEIKTLIPDVIDSLLDFHLNLLRRIRERIFKAPLVSTISDIVYNEFKSGEHRTAAVKAYTDFCLAQDSSDAAYKNYMDKNSNFRLFCENLERFPEFKKRSFQTCFLLIIQRMTKYRLLMEQLIKYESSPEARNESQRALTAVKNFALRVNHEMSCQSLNHRFEQVRSMIDKNSVGRVLGHKFTFDDLVLNQEEFRKILSIGTVRWQSVTHQSFELTMLLFDDIVVFLQNKNNALHFFTHKDHASVLPLHATLIREIPRSSTIMLIVYCQQMPDMYQLAFSNRNEMEQWISALNTAQKQAPKYVRMADRKLYVKGSKPSTTENGEESEEEEYNAQLRQWEDKLDIIFLAQMNSEPMLSQYMETRMKFLDQVRVHLINFPLRPHLDNKAVASSSTKSRETRELNKMKAILNSHFSELRSFRRVQLDKLVEHAQKSRDSDLSSFFDDLYELGHPNNSDSTIFSSSSDENQPSTSEKSCRPRRVRTWIGNKAETHQNDIVRRHTTVPKFSQQPGTSANDQHDSAEIDKRLRKLSLNSNSKAQRAATELIRENVALRLENDRLRSKYALQEIHLAALRARKTASETTEKIETLREKHEQLVAKEKEFRKEYEKLRLREQELDQKEAELREREQQCGKENISFELTDQDSMTSSGISRDTSFRTGAIIFNSSPTNTIQTSRSNSDVVPKHLAETKEKRAKK